MKNYSVCSHHSSHKQDQSPKAAAVTKGITEQKATYISDEWYFAISSLPQLSSPPVLFSFCQPPLGLI